jgi:hypothetical protein
METKIQVTPISPGLARRIASSATFRPKITAAKPKNTRIWGVEGEYESKYLRQSQKKRIWGVDGGSICARPPHSEDKADDDNLRVGREDNCG